MGLYMCPAYSDVVGSRALKNTWYIVSIQDATAKFVIAEFRVSAFREGNK